MKAIILAAGQGIRLKPLTDNRPKCMVEFQGKPIIDYIIGTLRHCGIDDILVVNGYEKSMLEEHIRDSGVRFLTNGEFQTTNMVYTLFCAEEEMEGDLIISYADIIYSECVLSRLLRDPADIAVVVDKDWKKLWSLRMEDPLRDAETMILDQNGFITELGKKPERYEQIQGQYIGLIKISGKVLRRVREFYHRLDTNSVYDGKNFNNMYMTSFLQLIIERLMPVKAVLTPGGWIEIDSLEDIERLKNVRISRDGIDLVQPGS